MHAQQRQAKHSPHRHINVETPKESRNKTFLKCCTASEAYEVDVLFRECH